MEQAKWYYICFGHSIHVFGSVRDPKITFDTKVLIYQLKNSGIKRIGKPIFNHSVMYFKRCGAVWHHWYEIPVFCGKKKLNKLLMEAHLLGLEDELLIFERK